MTPEQIKTLADKWRNRAYSIDCGCPYTILGMVDELLALASPAPHGDAGLRERFTKPSPFFSCRGTARCHWCAGWESYPQMDEAGHGEDDTVGHTPNCPWVAVLALLDAPPTAAQASPSREQIEALRLDHAPSTYVEQGWEDAIERVLALYTPAAAEGKQP